MIHGNLTDQPDRLLSMHTASNRCLNADDTDLTDRRGSDEFW